MSRNLVLSALLALPTLGWGQIGRVEIAFSALDFKPSLQINSPTVSPLSSPLTLSIPAHSLAPALAPSLVPTIHVSPVAAILAAPSDGKKLPEPESKEQGWTPRDLDRVFDFSKAPAHASDIDLPPAGTGELGPDDVAWMRSEMVSGPNPIFSKEGFAYMVEGDPAQTSVMRNALRAGQKGLMPSILDVMYLSLVRSVEPGRMAVAAAAARRYSTELKAIATDPAIPPAVRSLAARAVRLFLDGDVLIEELARAKQALSALGKLDAKARSFLAPQSAAELPSSTGRWSIPEPIAEHERVREAQDLRFPLSLTKISGEISAALFKLEKLSARYYSAARKGSYSPDFVSRLYDDLNSHLSKVFSWIPNAYSNITRFPLGTLRKPFSAEDKRHSVLRIPDNKDLRMTEEPGGFLVTARFETDIQDAEVLKLAKKSIEDYWRGIFELKGQGAKHFRTVVTFKTLPPGTAFSEGSLQLVDGKEGVSNVVGDRLTLGRSWSYDTPAHEFGHILGLADEYSETYSPDRRASEYVMPANLMGSYPNSVVLERHFKTAYFLLRRRSWVR